MPSRPRERCEAEVYHVYARAVGRMLLFEDDLDRRSLLGLLGRKLEKHPGELLAWCLMGNHYHLVVRMPLESLSEYLRVVNLTYAQRFNARYDRAGHVFQSRFGSQPIESDRQLLWAKRYVHMNPVKAGICEVGEYRWSSYGEYVGHPTWSCFCDTSFALGLVGGVDAFIRLHSRSDDGGFTFIDDEVRRSRTRAMPDSAAIEVGTRVLGQGWRLTLPQEAQPIRNQHLIELRKAGLSINQIERLTGIGRGIIQKVSNDRIP